MWRQRIVQRYTRWAWTSYKSISYGLFWIAIRVGAGRFSDKKKKKCENTIFKINKLIYNILLYTPSTRTQLQYSLCDRQPTILCANFMNFSRSWCYRIARVCIVQNLYALFWAIQTQLYIYIRSKQKQPLNKWRCDLYITLPLMVSIYVPGMVWVVFARIENKFGESNLLFVMRIEYWRGNANSALRNRIFHIYIYIYMLPMKRRSDYTNKSS